ICGIAASGSQPPQKGGRVDQRRTRRTNDSDVTAAVDPDLVLLESGLRPGPSDPLPGTDQQAGHAILASRRHSGSGQIDAAHAIAARMSRWLLEASAALYLAGPSGQELATFWPLLTHIPEQASSVAQTQPVCLPHFVSRVGRLGRFRRYRRCCRHDARRRLSAVCSTLPRLELGGQVEGDSGGIDQPAFQLAVRSNLRCVLSLNWRTRSSAVCIRCSVAIPELLHTCQCIDWYSRLEPGHLCCRSSALARPTAQAAAAAHVTAGRMLSSLYAVCRPSRPCCRRKRRLWRLKNFLAWQRGLAGDLRRAAIRDIELSRPPWTHRSWRQRQRDRSLRPSVGRRDAGQAFQQQREKYKAQLDACREQEAKVKQLRWSRWRRWDEEEDFWSRLNWIRLRGGDPSCRVACSRSISRKSAVIATAPEPVKAVMSVICMLFDTETESWEAAKELMIEGGFAGIIALLRQACPIRNSSASRRPCRGGDVRDGRLERIQSRRKVRDWLEGRPSSSRPCRGDLNPAIGALRAAEERVSREQTRLGRMRVEAQKQLESLNAAIGLHREASLAARQLRQRIARMQAEGGAGAQLMQRLDRALAPVAQPARARRGALGDGSRRRLPGRAVATYEVGCRRTPGRASYRTFLLDFWRLLRLLPASSGPASMVAELAAGDCELRQPPSWPTGRFPSGRRARRRSTIRRRHRTKLSDASNRWRPCAGRLRHRNLSALEPRALRVLRDGVGTGDTPMRRLLDLVFPATHVETSSRAPPVAGEASEATKPARSDRPAGFEFQEQPSGQSSRDSFESGDDGERCRGRKRQQTPAGFRRYHLERVTRTAAQCGAAVLLVNFEASSTSPSESAHRPHCSTCWTAAAVATVGGFGADGIAEAAASVVACAAQRLPSLKNRPPWPEPPTAEDGGDARLRVGGAVSPQRISRWTAAPTLRCAIRRRGRRRSAGTARASCRHWRATAPKPKPGFADLAQPGGLPDCRSLGPVPLLQTTSCASSQAH
uniref:ANK_REP_REGION domain-containing protein n=1 Tax=Macrostomum lignano TaxID=282301 RepID=A0A1I8F6E0_9PLAT